MDLKRTRLGEWEFFLEVAETGSLHEVARSRELEVAQLSRTLKRLETRVGRSLFSRSHRGLLLTAEGREVKTFVERGLKEFNSLGQRKPTLRAPAIEGAGSPSFLMNSLVLPMIAQMKSDEQLTSAKVVELPPDRLVLSGLRGIIQIAFHAGALEWPRTWVSEELGNLRWGLFGSRKFFKKNILSEAEVCAHDFVYPVYWSPEGLREIEDKCPLLLRHRRLGVGVSSGWMAKKILSTAPSLSFLPFTLIQNLDREQFLEIKVPEWPEVSQTVFVSIQSDRVSKKLFKLIVGAGKKSLASTNI